MANGLRKLIRKTHRQFINPAKLTRRINRFGPRLKVEELEERIAPAALAAGEYTPYDTATGVGVLYNAGATAVDITWTDTGGANSLDTLVIDLNTAGAVSLIATDELNATAADVVTDSANATLTLQTGINIADIGTLSAAIGTGHLDGADPGNNAAVTATGGDVVGNIDLDNGASTLTSLSITDGGTGDGDFTGAVTTDGSVGAVTVANNIGGGVWTVGAQLTGAWTVGGDITAAADITAATGTTAAAIFTVTGDLAGDIITSAGAIAGNITVTGNITGAITGDGNISGNITSSGTLGNVTSTDGSISGNISAAGNIGNIDADSNGTGTISGTITSTASGNIGNIAAGGTISGAITSAGTLGNVTSTDGSITGAISAAGNIGNIDADSNGAGVLSSAITSTAAGNIGNIAAGGNISGAITSAGTIGTITSLNGSLSGNVSAAGNIGAITLDADESGGGGATSGLITGTITTTNAGTIGFIDVGGNITAAITSAATIAGLRTDGNLAAAVTAGTGFITNAIQIDDGILAAGSLVATTGGFSGASDITIDTVGMAGAITATAGGIAADITVAAGGLGGTVTATAGGISGNILVTAGGLGGTVTATAGGISGTITVTAGGLGGSVLATAGGISGLVTVTAGGLSGSVTAAAGGISGGVTVTAGGLSGSVIATTGNIDTTAITVTAGGLSGTVQATAGDIDSNVTITAGGVTSTGLIKAGTNIDGNVTIADGGLTGTIQTVNGDITGDIDIQDAGAGVGIAATGQILAGNGDIDGNIDVAAGGVVAGGTINADANIDGDITVAAGSIAGSILTGLGDITGDIDATTGAITGTISTTVGDLTGSITAGAGNITNVNINGDIDSTGGAVTIAATAGAATVSSKGIVAAGNNLTISGDDGLTLTVVGTVASSGGATLLLAGDVDGDTTGDVAITSTGAWTNTGGTTNVTGENISLNSGGNLAFDAITADDDVTLVSATGTLSGASVTAGAVVATGNIVSVTSTGAMSFSGNVTAATDIISIAAGTTLTAAASNFTATTGDVVSITAGGNTIVNNVTAGDDITDISVTGTLTMADVSATDITNIQSTGTMTINSATATTGNVVNIEADSDNTGGGSLLDGDGGTLITAAAGDVTNVEGTGITGNITATAGKVVEVDAGSGAFNGTIISNVATSASPLLLVTSGSVEHTINTDATGTDAEFDITYTDDGAGGANPTAAIVVDILAGSAWDLSLKTDAVGGALSSAVFDLSSLTFDGTTTSRALGVVTVDGNVTASLNLEGALPNNSSMEALIVQENLLPDANTDRVLVGNLSLLIANTIGGVEATAALADQVTDQFGGAADPGSVDLNETYIIPVPTTALQDVDVFAPGAGTFSPSISLIGFVAGSSAGEVSMQLVNSALGVIDGLGSGAGVNLPAGVGAGGLDLSSFGGPITVNGDVDGALTLGDNEGVTITGAVNADVTGTDVDITGDFSSGAVNSANITLDTVSGNFTTGALTGAAISLSSVGGNVTLGNVDATSTVSITDSSTLTATDITGNFTAGTVAGPLTLGGIGGNVTVGELDATLDVDTSIGGNLALGGNADAAVTIGGSVGGSVTVTFAVNAAFTTGGSVGSLSTGAITAPLTIGGDVNGNMDTDAISAAVSVGDIDGDLDIGGNVSGTFTAGDVDGDVDITGSVTAAVTMGEVDGDFYISGSTSGAGVLTVGDIVEGDFEIENSVNANVTVGELDDGDFETGAIGDTTDVLVTVGDVSGTSTVASVGSDSTLDMDIITDDLTVTGAMEGTLILVGDNSDNDVFMGSMGSAVLIFGSLGDLIAAGDLGVAGGSVVAATEHIDLVSSTGGDVLANIFTGGDEAAPASMVISAPDGVVSGAFAVGLRGGVAGLSVISAVGGEADEDVVVIDDGTGPPPADAPAAIMANAGNFDGTNTDEFTTVILGSDAVNLTVSNSDGPDGANIGDIFIGDDFAGSIEINEDITGTITVDDDADVSVLLNDVLNFNNLAAGLTDPGEVANAAAFATALAALGTSELELVFGDDGGPVSLSGDASIGADNVGGLLVAGDIGTLDAPTNPVEIAVVDTMGFIVSLNGSVYAEVHAGISIGSIVASVDIFGEFISEGTLGLDALDGSTIDGVPDWFQGGILAEVGSIGTLSDPVLFAAQAGATLVNGFLVPSGDAMGTVYVLVGDIYASVDCFGDFGGVVAAAGTGTVDLSIPDAASIDVLIAPNASIIGNYNPENVGIMALSGANVLVGGQTATFGNMSVELVGAGVTAVIDVDTTMFDSIFVTGLASGTEVLITGDVDLLTIDGNWAGLVEVNEVASNDTEGVVNTAVVNGNVDGTFAEFEAFSFGEMIVSGTNGQMTTGSMVGGEIDTWTNINGDDQLLYLGGSSSNVEADWTQVFGQLTEIEVAGRGSAGLLSMNFSGTAPTASEANRIVKRVPRGDADLYNMGDGNAHLGDVEIAGHNYKLKLKEVVVDGNLNSLTSSSPAAMKGLWVSGNADEISVATGITQGFIGGNVNLFATGKAKKVIIDGNVGTMALARADRVVVQGTTDILRVVGNTRGAGKLINSHFLGYVTTPDIGDRIINSTINGHVI